MPRSRPPHGQAAQKNNFQPDKKQALEAKTTPIHENLQKPTANEYIVDRAIDFFDILAAVAKEIPVPGVGAVVEIASKLVRACQESHATLERAEDLALRIKILVSAVVDGLKGKGIEEIPSKLKEDVNSLHNDLRYLERKLDDITSQNSFLLVLFRRLNEEKIQKCMNRLDSSLERFHISRHIDTANVLEHLQTEIFDFYEAQKKALTHIEASVDEVKGEVHYMKEAVGDVKLTMQEMKVILSNGSSSESGTRTIIPANTATLYGRNELIAEIVAFLVNMPGHPEVRHTCILGPGGMGKTSTALAVMAHENVKKRYPRHSRVWVPCVKATSVALFFDTLALSLGITKATGSTRENILSVLEAAEPLILLLDNFEMPWNVDGGRSEVEQMLRDIDLIPKTVLFLTMRSSALPSKGIRWHSIHLKAVDTEAAHQIYTGICPEGNDDPELPELINLVGHMPLAITLLATSASLSGLSAKDLTNQYQKIGTMLLGQGSDSEHSMDTCISLSVDSPPMKRKPEAKRLLAILALLPTGTTYNMIETWWARDLSNVVGALEVLRETSLLELRNSIFFILPVIQRYVLHPSRFPSDVRSSMIAAACDFLKQHNTFPGDESYTEHTAALAAEDGNLEAVLLQATAPTSDIIEALLALAKYQASTRPRTNVIEHAIKLVVQMENNERLHGASLSCYATICHNLNRYSDARTHLSEARQMFLSMGDTKQASECLLREVDTYQVDMALSAEKQNAIIAKAQAAFESINDRHGVALCQYNLGISTQISWDHRGALSLLESARDTFAETKDILRLAQCSHSIAKSYFWLQQYEEAEIWAQSAIQDFTLVGPSDGATDAAKTLGRIHNARHNYNAALAVLAQCLEQFKSFGAPMRIGNTLEEMGRAWAKLGKTEDARAAFQEALHVVPSIPGRKDAVRCRYFLRKLDDPSVTPTHDEGVQLERFYPCPVDELL